MEQLLSGNTESSSTGTHGAAPSFCSTRSTEQLQTPVEHYGERAHTAALPGAHIQQILFSEHVQLLHRSTWIELLLPWDPGEHRAALLEHVEQQLSRSRYRCST